MNCLSSSITATLIPFVKTLNENHDFNSETGLNQTLVNKNYSPAQLAQSGGAFHNSQ